MNTNMTCRRSTSYENMPRTFCTGTRLWLVVINNNTISCIMYHAYWILILILVRWIWKSTDFMSRTWCTFAFAFAFCLLPLAHSSLIMKQSVSVSVSVSVSLVSVLIIDQSSIAINDHSSFINHYSCSCFMLLAKARARAKCSRCINFVGDGKRGLHRQQRVSQVAFTLRLLLQLQLHRPQLAAQPR